ncbi:MAG: type II toxin-antitoxin system ParD family antitoxin [Nannocystaceae bacterium]|nr:type II toxin-antitoxin system ParD family antitoxin [Nannocystaceae bacterium]
MSTISLSPTWQQFAEQEVASGRFSSIEAVVDAALVLLREDELKAIELRGQVEDTLGMFQRGELEPLDQAEHASQINRL